jgi:nucleoside-diphosphate-sugar epimerase
VNDAILLTGGTGFLGMELIARLLDHDDGGDILLPVRAPDRQGAQARVEELLGRLYETPPESAQRLRPMPADLASPGLGLSGFDRSIVRRSATRVVHCAASISFTLPLATARAINVEGTRRILDLARELETLDRVVHVSTAYVAGRGGGRFAETDLARGQRFRNTYERSKYEAELMARESELPTVEVRPSIVVGESDSGWTPAFNVVYWPLQAFSRGLLAEVPADPDGLVDMVPVDRVADVLEAATLAPEASGTYHAVAGERAITVAELVALTCESFERPAPRFTLPGTGDGESVGAEFVPYFDVAVRFDDRRARELVGGPAPVAHDYVPALLEYARTARWGKRPITRQAARERIAVAV